jgi:MOSC domain-containing protein YiiM
LSGKIEAIFIYPEEGGAPVAKDTARVVAGRGLEGDQRRAAHRAVTVLSLEQWKETLADLKADLPLSTRRANVIVSGVDLPSSVGKQLRLGSVALEVVGETVPCGTMDEAYQGLKDALAPGLRAGVHGRIVSEGTMQTGDSVEIVALGETAKK